MCNILPAIPLLTKRRFKLPIERYLINHPNIHFKCENLFVQGISLSTLLAREGRHHFKVTKFHIPRQESWIYVIYYKSMVYQHHSKPISIGHTWFFFLGYVHDTWCFRAIPRIQNTLKSIIGPCFSLVDISPPHRYELYSSFDPGYIRAGKSKLCTSK